MSMQPVPWPEPDPQIAAAIKAMYGSRKTVRPLAVEIRERLGQWLADEGFAAGTGIRACVTNYRTTRADIDLVIDRLLRLSADR